jgi:starvation-inducible DNA-binding protein
MKAGINIGLSDAARATVNEHLNKILAHEYMLTVKTQNYHWHVKGLSFKPFHLFFEEQYNALLEIQDEVAERVIALGGQALGTLAEFIKLSTLSETPGVVPGSDRAMVEQLLQDHEAVIRLIRQSEKAVQEVGDAGTINFLGGLLEKQEKMAWMLRATVS